MRFQGFGPGALRFYDELAENNNRAWFQENRSRYEDEVRAPLEYLLDDLAGEFGEAKVFRPNRDTRFSANKEPYKDRAAAVIHRDAGAWYVQLGADGIMVAGGSYMPARDQLATMREAVADEHRGTELVELVDGLRQDGFEVDARDKLKTAPRGYPSDHPRIELLRMKGLIALFEHPPAAWLHKPKARDQVAHDWRALGPLNAWLDRHVGPSTEPPDTRGR
jgi:uncharacterized protein (TIGR02453 family)